MWWTANKGVSIPFFKRSDYSNASLITVANLCSGPGWADENWPITRRKPIWLNYAQWLLGPTGRWHSWNRNEGQGLVKPPLFVYCGWLSSVLLLLRCKQVSHGCCWNLCWTGYPSYGNHVLLELLPFECGCFPVGRHSLDVWEEFALCPPPPPVPSLFWCAFGCSLPNQIVQLLHANLTLTDQVNIDLFDIFHKAWFFELLQKWAWLHKMRH